MTTEHVWVVIDYRTDEDSHRVKLVANDLGVAINDTSLFADDAPDWKRLDAGHWEARRNGRVVYVALRRPVK